MISVFINTSENKGETSFPVSNLYLEKYAFTESIFSLYTKGFLYIKDPFCSFSPFIKIGTEFLISFPHDVNTFHSMRVASFRKIPSTENSLVEDSIEVNLINSWFFEKNVYSTACEGNVSSIIQSEISKEGFFKKFKIEKGSDVPRTRYLLGKSLPEYINSIIKYGFKKADDGTRSPFVAFTEFGSSFIVSSLKTLSQENPCVLFVPWGNIIEAGIKIPADFESYNVVRMLTYSLISGGANIPSNDTLKVSRNLLLESNNKESRENFSNSLNGAFVSKEYPRSLKYSSWYNVPEDEISEYMREKEITLRKSSGLECVCPDEVIFDLGSTVNVILPQTFSMGGCTKFQVYEMSYMKDQDNITTLLKMFPVGD